MRCPDNRGWSLAPANKVTTQAQCGTNKASAIYGPLWLLRDESGFSVADDARSPVHTKKNQICIRLCIERDGAKYTVATAAVGSEVRVIVFHKR